MYPVQIEIDEATAARRRIPIWLVDATDGLTAETGVTGTPRIAKNGVSSAAASASIVQVDATNMPGLYYLELTAGEVDTLGHILISFKTAATAQWHGSVQIVGYDPYDGTGLGVANLDAAVTSRAVAGDSMALTAAAINLIWDELTSESRTASSFGQLFKDVLDANITTRATPTEVNAQVVDVMNVDTIAELSVAAPAATPTINTALMLIYMALRNKLDVTATFKEVHNDAGTIVTKKALTDDGTTYSEAEMETG